MHRLVEWTQRATTFVRTLPARIARVRKAAVPVVTGALALAAVLLGADSELVVAATALAAACGVYRAKNAPPVT